ncbi:MAG: thioesterase family protein [Myxococcales bacterium]|nr:thioesterase family protein [Myxococcales bacterium]MDD9971714.1 thioesterase family protein [Myxococcales bacterium]
MHKHQRSDPSPEFRQRLVAPEADVDELGHISNVAYVRWLQDVATAHSDAVGFPTARYQGLGSIFVVRRHEIDYLRAAFAGDDLELTTHVAWFRGATSERRTRIVRCRDGLELVRAATLWAFVAIDSGRPRRIPPAVSEAFYTTPARPSPDLERDGSR